MANATDNTVGHVIQRTFDLLLGARREERNQVATTVATTDTSISVTYAVKGAQRGTYLAIDDEVMYVWTSADGVGGGNGTITVSRGEKGTVATSHASGTDIQVNPFFTKYQIRETLREEIRSWGPQVYAVKTVAVTSKDFVRGYDLGAIAPFYRVLEVRESPDTLSGITSDKGWPRVKFKVVRGAPTTDFASGNGLIITDPQGVFDSPRTFWVVYAAPFNVDTTFGDSDDLVATIGLDSTDLDIPPYGAAWRLASGREMGRTFTEAQGQPADLKNEPPLHAMRAADGFKKYRDSRLGDAEIRLANQYPTLGK